MAAVLRRQAVVRRAGQGFAATGALTRHPLCTACIEWLWRVLADVSNGSSRVVGAPGPASRVRIFDDQCVFCREVLGKEATSVSARSTGTSGRETEAMLVCAACDVWLAGIAADGQSARGETERTIDGAYGRWPHANLRDLAVSYDISDRGARELFLATCDEMGVRAAPAGTFANAAILAIDSTPARPAHSVLSTVVTGTRRLVLVPAGGIADLRECLALGIDGWLTVPATPQQLAATLGRLARHPGLEIRWDTVNCLPVVDPWLLGRGVLRVEPAAGMDPAQAAWLVRRVSRGYDESGSHRGQIVVIPRVPEGLLGRVAERLQRALAERCTIEIVSELRGSRPRFDVAG